MFEFFDAVASFADTIVNFVLGTIEMIGSLLMILYSGVLFLFGIFPNLPPFCMTFLTVTVGIAVLIQILNKGG